VVQKSILFFISFSFRCDKVFNRCMYTDPKLIEIVFEIRVKVSEMGQVERLFQFLKSEFLLNIGIYFSQVFFFLSTNF
jgi:hypothetical protein